MGLKSKVSEYNMCNAHVGNTEAYFGYFTNGEYIGRCIILVRYSSPIMPL